MRDPIGAIDEEASKAQKAPDKVGIMAIKSANDWVDDGLAAPDPKMYFHDLIVEHECTVVIASSNSGKSHLLHAAGRSLCQRRERPLHRL